MYTILCHRKKYGFPCIAFNIKPGKTNPNQVCITIAWSNIKYPNNVVTPIFDMTTTKILLNSVLGTDNAKFLTLDIKNIYLQTDLDAYECMHILYNLFTDKIQAQYKLDGTVHNNWG